MRIAQALELPVKINITGDPQKDAEIVLYALAGCVGLLIICILLLVIITVRRSRRRKRKAALVLAEQQALEAAGEEHTQEESTAAEHSSYRPKKEEPEEIAAETVVINTPEVKPETPAPADKTAPEPVLPEPKQEESHTHTSHIHIEEDPEKKMEEIRRRIAEIAEKRRTEAQEYKEISLPKLGIDYGQQETPETEEAGEEEFVQAHKWDVETPEQEVSPEEIPVQEEIEYAPEDHDMQVPETAYTESGHSDMWIRPEAETVLQQEEQPEAPVYAQEHIHTLTEDVAAEHHLPPAAEIHPLTENPAVAEEPEPEPEPEPVVIQGNKDLDTYFQNTQLPLKRLTFAEWVDQFKK